jgi:predicted transcriptional regulator of viral defense system
MKKQLSLSIIREFLGKNKLGFVTQEVKQEFPERNELYLARLLAEMVREGMLLKVAPHTYLIIPFQADSESYVPNGHLAAKYIMQDREYYIGYASAMKIHGLTLLSGIREYVVTKRQMKPSVRTLRGITFQFIHHDSTRFFGYSSHWITKSEQAMVSDLERTLVDGATRPQLCGGIVALGRAIFQARERVELDKLFYYFARNNSLVAKKRYLFLTDLLGLEWTDDHESMMDELGTSISWLDPEGPKQGPKQCNFGLKINVVPQHIKRKVLAVDLY